MSLTQPSIKLLISAHVFAFQTNEKGQVVTKTSLLKQMEELIEEPGLTCCICREGYKFQVQQHIKDYEWITSYSISSIVKKYILFFF